MTITVTVFYFLKRGLLELDYNYNYNFYSPGIRIDSILVRRVRTTSCEWETYGKYTRSRFSRQPYWSMCGYSCGCPSSSCPRGSRGGESSEPAAPREVYRGRRGSSEDKWAMSLPASKGGECPTTASHPLRSSRLAI